MSNSRTNDTAHRKEKCERGGTDRNKQEVKAIEEAYTYCIHGDIEIVTNEQAINPGYHAIGRVHQARNGTVEGGISACHSCLECRHCSGDNSVDVSIGTARPSRLDGSYTSRSVYPLKVPIVIIISEISREVGTACTSSISTAEFRS
jgi:hypothetical protein